MKDFMKKLTGFSVGPIIGAIIGFITVPVTTYFILPVEYGKASMFTLVQSILTMVVYLGLDQSFVNYYHEVKEKDKLLTNSMIMPLCFSVMLCITTIIFASDVSVMLFDSSKYVVPIYILAISIPFMVIERFVLLQLRMQEMALRYSLFNVVLKIIIFLITLYFIYFVRRDFLAIVYSTIVGQILGDVLLLILYHKYININVKLLDKNQAIELLKFGIPLIIVSIIGWLFNSMDRIFLKIFRNYEEIGYYTAAMKLTNMLLIIQSSFAAFWVPTAYRWRAEKVSDEQYVKVSKALSLCMSLFLMIILLFKNIIIIVLSAKYSNSIAIFPFLLFYPIFYTISETTVLGIPFSKKSHLNIIVSVISLVVNFILCLALTPIFGATGTACATGVSYIAFFWARTIISRRLWFKFDIKCYIYMTTTVFIVAFINTFFPFGLVAYISSFLGGIAILFIYKDVCKYFLSKIKGNKLN